ncbi:hypothetical protein [Variovorax sp. IB41]|uniref:hypothetical protein n=1 Tax=Variovorax sp. IB41 TaxID=2779370 RepID=UPI0018E7A158|nr:hypothetical protein [Variovorax sp. IB41]MBJ2157313.1 hypothetical protein [Variovorax sp. IB41]
MKSLAAEVVRYLWALVFLADDTFRDDNFVADEIERISFEMADEYSPEEQQAVMAVAREWLDAATAEPDAHGYTPRKLSTPEQREFLESLAAGAFMNAAD